MIILQNMSLADLLKVSSSFMLSKTNAAEA